MFSIVCLILPRLSEPHPIFSWCVLFLLLLCPISRILFLSRLPRLFLELKHLCRRKFFPSVYLISSRFSGKRPMFSCLFGKFSSLVSVTLFVCISICLFCNPILSDCIPCISSLLQFSRVFSDFSDSCFFSSLYVSTCPISSAILFSL